MFEEKEHAASLWSVMFSTVNSSLIAVAGTKSGARILDIRNISTNMQVQFDFSDVA